MNTLITVLGSLLDPARAPFVVSLLARWTVLLSVAVGMVLSSWRDGREPRSRSVGGRAGIGPPPATPAAVAVST